MPAGDLLLPVLEVKVRHVRTPQGSRKYKKPIGAEIPAGATRVHGAFFTQALPRGWHLYKHTGTFYAHHLATGTVLKGSRAWQVAEQAQQLHLRRKDVDLDLERKVRHVRTPEGSRTFHKPIGSVITGVESLRKGDRIILAANLAFDVNNPHNPGNRYHKQLLPAGTNVEILQDVNPKQHFDVRIKAGGQEYGVHHLTLAAALPAEKNVPEPEPVHVDAGVYRNEHLNATLTVHPDGTGTMTRGDQTISIDAEQATRWATTSGFTRQDSAAQDMPTALAGMLARSPDTRVRRAGAAMQHAESPGTHPAAAATISKLSDSDLDLLAGKIGEAAATDDPKIKGRLRATALHLAAQHGLPRLAGLDVLSRLLWAERDRRTGKSLIEDLEVKVRHVRTPGGVRAFHKPIGSVIAPGDVYLHPETGSYLTVFEGAPGSTREHLRGLLYTPNQRGGMTPRVVNGVHSFAGRHHLVPVPTTTDINTPGPTDRGGRNRHGVYLPGIVLGDKIRTASGTHTVRHLHPNGDFGVSQQQYSRGGLARVSRHDVLEHTSRSGAMPPVTKSLDGLEVEDLGVLELKVRKVKTPQGVRKYKKPIGTIISSSHADLSDRVAGAAMSGHDVFHIHGPAKHHKQVVRAVKRASAAAHVPLAVNRTKKGWQVNKVAVPFAGAPAKRGARDFAAVMAMFKQADLDLELKVRSWFGEPQQGSTRMPRSDTLEEDDRASEVKVRHVRTASGARYYHEPIGAPIVGHPRAGVYRMRTSRRQSYTGDLRVHPSGGGSIRYQGRGHQFLRRSEVQRVLDQNARDRIPTTPKPARQLPGSPALLRNGKLPPGRYGVQIGGIQHVYIVRRGGRVDDVDGGGELFDGQNRLADMPGLRHLGPIHGTATRARKREAQDRWKARHANPPAVKPAAVAKPAARFPAGTYLVTFPGQAHKQVEYRVDASGVGRWRDGQAFHWIGPRGPAEVAKDLSAAHIISGPGAHRAKPAATTNVPAAKPKIPAPGPDTVARYTWNGPTPPPGKAVIDVQANGYAIFRGQGPDQVARNWQSIVKGPNWVRHDLQLDSGPAGGLGSPARLVNGKLPVGRYALVSPDDGHRVDYVVHRNGDAAMRDGDGPARKVPADKMAGIAQMAGPNLRRVGPLHRTASRARRQEAAARFRAKKAKVDPFKPGKYVRADVPGLEYQVQQDGHVRVVDRAVAKRGGAVGSYTLTPSQWHRVVQVRLDHPNGAQLQFQAASPAAAVRRHPLKPGWYQRQGRNGGHLEYHIHEDYSGTGYAYPAGHSGSAPQIKHYQPDVIAKFIADHPHQKFQPINGPRVGVAGPANDPKPGYYTLQMGGVHYAYDVHDDGKVFVVATDSDAAMARPVELDKAGQRDVWLHVAGQFQAAERPGPKVYHWQGRPSEQIILDPTGGAHAEVGGRQFPLERSYAEARLAQHPDDWKLQAGKAKQVSGPVPGDTFLREGQRLNILADGSGQLVQQDGTSQKIAAGRVRQLLAGGDWKLRPQSGLSQDGQFHLPGLDRTAVGKPAGGVTGDATPIADDRTLQQILTASFNAGYQGSVTDAAGNTWKIKAFGDDNSTSTFKVTGPDGKHYLLKHPDHNLGQPQSLQVEVAADLMARHAGYSDWPAGQIIMSRDTVTGVITEFVDNPKGYHLSDDGWTNHLYDFPATDILTVGIFDYVIDNTDRHLMNGGAVETADEWHFIPFDNNLAMGYSNEGNATPKYRPGRHTLEEFVDQSPPYAQGSWPLKDGNGEYDDGVRGVIMKMADREIIAAYDDAQRRWASVEMDSIPGIDEKQRAQVKQRIGDLLTHREENLRYLGVSGPIR